MKTLLMLLLFTSVSFTQDNVNLVARVKDQRNKEYFEKYDLVFANIYNGSQSKEAHLVTLSSIVKLWEDYQKECYADSTADTWSREYINWRADEDTCVKDTVCYYVPRLGLQTRIDKMYFGFKFDGYKYTRYFHKQPTFEGFIAYLKRR